MRWLMQKIIDKLNSMIAMENSTNMTSEQECYVDGLADAIQVIEEMLAEELIIGQTYFVIMYKRDEPYIEKMKLYRINDRSRKTYCFTKNIDSKSPTPDLVLISEHSLKARVFNSREKAERGINLLI